MSKEARRDLNRGVMDLKAYNDLIRALNIPGGPDGKESTCNALDSGSISGKGRSPREGNGNPLQYSCLENLMDRGAWQTTVHRFAKSQTRLK